MALDVSIYARTTVDRRLHFRGGTALVSRERREKGSVGMQAIIDYLTFYPVKGLSGQPLDRVALTKGEGFPHDRAYGFARPNSGFDPENPAPLPKTKFVVLARDAALARIKTQFDVKTGMLDLSVEAKCDRFDVNIATGRDGAANFIAQHLNYDPQEMPTLFSAAPHKFTDVSVVSPNLMNAVSLINRDSVTAFSAKIGENISPARFRGNIVFSGVAPFEELNWLGREIKIGSVQLKVVMRTKRCAATEVNLDTGERDVKVPQLLHKLLGHFDMGIYAEVSSGGLIAPGDTISLQD